MFSLTAEIMPTAFDEDDKVRMEAPEMFRVMGKRRPEFVMPYIEQLQIL